MVEPIWIEGAVGTGSGRSRRIFFRIGVSTSLTSTAGAIRRREIRFGHANLRCQARALCLPSLLVGRQARGCRSLGKIYAN